jgi:hypothetical protein
MKGAVPPLGPRKDDRNGAAEGAKIRALHRFVNWTTRQSEQEGKSSDAHRRLTLDSPCSRGGIVKAALCG